MLHTKTSQQPSNTRIPSRCWMQILTGLLVLTVLQTSSLDAADTKPETAKPTDSKPEAGENSKDKQNWISLFDGKTLEDWKKTNFGGEGEVEVKDGRILMHFGSDMTGVHTERKLPKNNYEVELEAMRVDGSDFFCGLTFPVKKDHCSLIVGGWGGGVVGLSSINGFDASENDTTSYRQFKAKQWYSIRVRVTDESIQAWIDDKRVVNQTLKDRKISTRVEVEPSKPFGISCWQTTAALKNIRYRELDKKELKTSRTP